MQTKKDNISEYHKQCPTLVGVTVGVHIPPFQDRKAIVQARLASFHRQYYDDDRISYRIMILYGGAESMAERTKIWIADTMNRLLQRKSIENIRVTEICREAEIERPTFYYHFRDKYELMAWMFCRKALGTDILSVESAAKSMNGMRQDFIFYKRAYEDHSQNPMWSYMVGYFAERYVRLAKEKLGTETLDARLQYCIRLYCHGAVGMTREWLLKDNITPAETVVRMMLDAMPEAMRRVYFSDEDGTAWQKAKQGSQ